MEQSARDIKTVHVFNPQDDESRLALSDAIEGLRAAIGILSDLRKRDEELERMAGDPATFVRVALAQRPDLSPALQERMAGDSDWHVRAALAQRPDLSPALQEQLGRSQ